MICRRQKNKDTDDRALLREALRAGVHALMDTEIETRVSAYFDQNPNYSRDAVHVAAIACRFQAEKAARVPQRASILSNAVLSKP